MISDLAISIRGLSKAYTITHKVLRRPTFRDVVMDRLRHPLQRPQRETFWALKDISFDVRRGEVVGIIGSNGAGKSTLLKILSRITEPTSGRIDLFGRVGSLLEVGTGFHPELTGRENIYLNGSILGMTRGEIRKQFDAIVDFAEVEKFLDTPVKRYSSGMYVRLAFAVAAHLNPKILLVDEVLAVGDAEFQEKCLGKMGEVAHDGRTVLFVSHNMGAVQQLCSMVLTLRSGTCDVPDSDVAGAVAQYLGTAQGHGRHAEWLNTQHEFCNAYFMPLRLCVCDECGVAICGPISRRGEAWVQLEGEVAHTDPSLTIGYALMTTAGELLYWSYPTDTESNLWPTLKPGRCVLRSKIPTEFLNESEYCVELIGGLHFREWLFMPGTGGPSVYFSLRGDLSDSPYWTAKRPGVCAPIIQWASML